MGEADEMKAIKSFTCLAIVAACFAFAAPAGAHTAMVTGVAACSDGAHRVTWTITNDQPHRAMTLAATSAVGGTAYGVSIVTNPVPGGGTTHASTVVPGGVTGTITITVHATWTDEFMKTVTATVGLPTHCSPTATTTPPTTTPPTTAPTETTAPTATTAPPTSGSPTSGSPTSAGVLPTSNVPTTAPSGVAGVESGPGDLAFTGASNTGAVVAVALGLLMVGAGLLALKRRPSLK
jgi:hypothetical protein